MIALIQRVKDASVTVAGELVSSIGPGMMILLGVMDDDTPEDLDWLVKKCSKMRIFPDEKGVMNCDINSLDGGEIMVVSQFTLAADIRKGNRPSYIKAMRPEPATIMYEEFCNKLSLLTSVDVKRGIFGADMDVVLTNWGPVTIIADSSCR